MSEELQKINARIDPLDRAIFGDRNDPMDHPGLFNTVQNLALRQDITNKILMEVRGDLRRINWMILAGFITAVCSLVYTNITNPVRLTPAATASASGPNSR
jgi:hypothetical protein